MGGTAMRKMRPARHTASAPLHELARGTMALDAGPRAGGLPGTTRALARGLFFLCACCVRNICFCVRFASRKVVSSFLI